MVNSVTYAMARDLKKAAREHNAPIWTRLAREALKPSSARRTVNLNKLSRFTSDGDAIFFAGKVLGTGSITHKITLGSFSISNTASRKVLAAGGEVCKYQEMINVYPTGKGVALLG